MPALRSRTSTAGRNAAGARALWRATGMTDADFGKPIIAVANSYTQFVPGHVHLKNVGEIVAEQLSLAAEPYPRRPGVKLEDVLPKSKGGPRRGAPGQQRHPFAGLAALRDKPRRGR